ncbi:GGDEF domain-containing protein [Nitrincola sp. MINF-07-Sa-05]|uniref:GGDEF domain-containing protein n=1 Tax=Nitrincola salilacus TaxID=3400273 RepID=UPI0039184AB7
MSLLLLGFLFTTSNSIFHWLDPDARRVDLIIPPGMAAIFLSLIITLLIRPIWDIEIAMLTLFVVVAVLTFSVWYFVFSAYDNDSERLVDTLPPVGSILIIISLVNMILLRTRHALNVSLLTWCLVAIPVISYLLFHPAELWSPRGKDLVVTLGPALLLVSLLLPFQRGLRKQVEQLKVEHRKMQTISELDTLTKLFNRRAGERILRQVMTDKNAVGLAIFDVDHFKKINDTYGHPAGDKVLKELAQRCTEVIRKDGTVVRWGGEEFIVIFQHVEKSDLWQISERLRLCIFEKDIEPVGQVSASFGLVMATDFDTAESLLERADLALYEAKKAGRNCAIIGS